MFRILLILTALIHFDLARADCNPASQACDMDEIDEEMAAASQRGFAFIQAKSSRHTAKARKASQIKDSLAVHNEMVKEEVEKLAAKHGRGSVSHKRTMVRFAVEGVSE
mmetsp:Transcript_1300/g.1472  ORF Transcript_1300/g.1472 Transcript_1300/m.1472 type:complete len:109 (-) Transcript_1300:97-423(-)